MQVNYTQKMVVRIFIIFSVSSIKSYKNPIQVNNFDKLVDESISFCLVICQDFMALKQF